jgi:short-subunit dehydrogenase
MAASRWEDPRTVLITGATGGIGGSLAVAYARAGRTLFLHGRNTERLAAIRSRCEAAGARVVPLTFDLRDGEAVVQLLGALSQSEPIDLAIVNAGVTRMVQRDEPFESLATAREILAVNLDGALATLAGVLPEMQRRASGQIALVSSLAALRGLPRTPAYCASKAALKAYGEALRLWLAPRGIAVSVVLPGFVETEMTARVKGPKPWLMPPERAARLIRRGLERNRARIAFPRALTWGLLCLSILPQGLAERLVRALGFGGR